MEQCDLMAEKSAIMAVLRIKWVDLKIYFYVKSPTKFSK